MLFSPFMFHATERKKNNAHKHTNIHDDWVSVLDRRNFEILHKLCIQWISVEMQHSQLKTNKPIHKPMQPHRHRHRFVFVTLPIKIINEPTAKHSGDGDCCSVAIVTLGKRLKQKAKFISPPSYSLYFVWMLFFFSVSFRVNVARENSE